MSPRVAHFSNASEQPPSPMEKKGRETIPALYFVS